MSTVIRKQYIVKQWSDRTEWYFNGKLHNEAKQNYNDNDRWEYNPAVLYKDGTAMWYKHGVLHRDLGPAIEYANGENHWYFDGKLHREDGPAIESDEKEEYWIDGVQLTKEEFKNREKPKIQVVHEAYSEYGVNHYWYKADGKTLHREDGFAQITGSYADYYINGKHLSKEEFKEYTERKKIEDKKITIQAENLYLTVPKNEVIKLLKSGNQKELVNLLLPGEQI